MSRERVFFFKSPLSVRMNVIDKIIVVGRMKQNENRQFQITIVLPHLTY